MRRALLIALLAASFARAEEGGTTSAEFTKFGLGARSLGMGGAAVSVADDAEAVYWNPANLSRLESPHFTMMRADVLESGHYHAAAFAMPARGLGAWGGAVQTMSVGSIGATDETGLGLGDISPRDTSASVGWGRGLGRGWSVGAGGEWVRSTVIHTANAFSLDAGLSWRHGPWAAGAAGKRLAATQLKFSDEKSPLPRALQAGLSWRAGRRVTLAFDVNDTRGSAWVYCAGAEYTLPLAEARTLSFRAGYQTRPRDLPGAQGASLGVGWGWQRLQMDYAFLPMGSVDGAQTHRISIGMRVGVRPAAPAPRPESPGDADNDGVADDRDVCPGTHPGTRVGATGCPVLEDEDGDRVEDAADRCPGTPAGRVVDVRGCPVDDDLDGVLNEADQCPDTPEGRVVDGHGCPLTLRLNLEFENGSARVNPAYEEEIRKAADFLASNPQFNAEVEGHSDASGGEAANLALSEARAGVVRQVLIHRFGAAPERISAKGYGESRPIADNATAEGRQRNRRVLVTLTRPERP